MRLRRRAAVFAGAAAVLLASVSATAVTGLLYQRLVRATGPTTTVVHPSAVIDSARQPDRQLPAGAAFTVLVDSYPDNARAEPAIRQLTAWLESSGHRVYYQNVDLGRRGRWRRVLAGTYTDREYETASWDAARLKAAAPVLEARVVSPAEHAR